MHIPLVCSFILFFFPFLDAQVVPCNKPLAANELDTLNELIAATQRSLGIQIELREKILRYQELQRLSMENEDNFEQLYRLAKSAHIILETIKEQHLLQTFDAAFISELTLVSKPAAKRGIPRP